MNSSKVTVEYSQLRLTSTVEAFLDSQNYDMRRKQNLARRASVTMNMFINHAHKHNIDGFRLPIEPHTAPTVFSTRFEVRGQDKTLISHIKFGHITEGFSVILDGDLYISEHDESRRIIDGVCQEFCVNGFFAIKTRGENAPQNGWRVGSKSMPNSGLASSIF
jgi:hypothetical protein